MLKLYAKALAGSTVLPAVRKLPGIGGTEGLPDRTSERSDVEVDRHHLAEYNRVCGFRLRDELPPTYPHIVAFPLAMELMTDTSFPFPVMGLVHIGNRIEVLRPLRADEGFSVRVWAGDLEDHPRGTQFQVHAEAGTAWRSSSTYLHRSGGSGNSGDKEQPPPAPQLPSSAVWEIPGDIGRRYAAVSGDRNPIHLHPLAAKAFGMKSNIAHGMWTKARCLAALESELPDAYTVEVRFKLPIFLPSKVTFSTDTKRFEVRSLKDGKPHLEGQLG